jgi:hypothetical protein
MLGIERKQMLQALNDVSEYKSCGAENKHGARILSPGHFLVGLHPRESIEQAFAWNKDHIEKCLPPFEDTRHVASHGFSEEKNRGKKQSDLEPTVE